jgi:hypothetical protein
MSILEFLRPPERPHAAFGPLQFARGRWRGTIDLEPGARVPLFIPGARGGPDEDAVRFAEGVAALWSRVRPRVESELWSHYTNGRDADMSSGPEIASQREIWQHVTLSSVQVQPYRARDEFLVAIRAAWDDEHTLGAVVRGAELVELNGSILEAR